MLRWVLLVLCLSACGRSGLSDPPTEPIQPASPSQTTTPVAPSPLIGHWAEFHLGNCINDEAWLSFAEGGQLTVTSIDRNFCSAHSIAAAQGTWSESAQTLQLDWQPVRGTHSLKATFAVVPLTRPVEWTTEGYTFGNREISMRVWRLTGSLFERLSIDRTEEDGKVYARDSRAEVTFDTSPVDAAVGSTITATLHWRSTLDWAESGPRQLDETFTLPCRVTLESGARHVRAVVLDQYDGFWKLLTARGLDQSYGWDLDRLIHSFGPDWTVDAEGRLVQGHSYDAPEYLELQHPPPTQP
jgi:hypothetical protein